MAAGSPVASFGDSAGLPVASFGDSAGSPVASFGDSAGSPVATLRESASVAVSTLGGSSVMAMAALRSVVFDVGNVLVDWNPRAFFARHIADPARLDRFLSEVATLEWHTQHDAGRPFAETSAELIARFPEEAGPIRLWGEHFLEQIGDVLPGMAALIADLAAAGVPLYAITNFSQEFWPPFAAREADLFAPFRDIVVSGAVKLVKPDPAIYALALQRFGLAPGEALFVDDREENVIAAEQNGFRGHVFRDAPTLRAAIMGYGLL